MRPPAAVATAPDIGAATHSAPDVGSPTDAGSAATGAGSAATERAAASATHVGSEPRPVASVPDVQETRSAPNPGEEPHPESLAQATTDVERMREPLPFTPTVFPGRTAFERPAPRPEPRRYGPFTTLQWVGAGIVAGAGALFALAMIVFATRWLVSLEPLRDFLTTYPGEYHLPESAPVGLPAWLGWQHFLNAFFMLLIIRSGLQVRREKRPSAFWTPRWNSKRKTSLTIWFHQSLDLLWLVNGLVFLVLLFVTGQWMRIVPTSWEVLPNALSAMLQYASLDWPTENGWVNYNSLQQLAYFTTVFVAAPLAILTGVRMSGLWPRKAETLNRAYPIEWARKVHFPVMLYFVAFIIVHVALVFATGALRNLNHMYAAQGSTDPTAYADNWAGFWIFAASVLVMAGGWIAARPLVLAPIARLFGTVSAR
ncbi:cytochrome b/b6 domain-containing protein [Microbacterium sp. RG1]|uniref:cytochrome b/b6 domain-containing protein n=1 Tax=Microbacterium sp. RG1 TaxID=2489212 RepID=UPI001EE3830E|nr:cytochrome b/b6 domain-containing protein [Microbacterium sp. RG1]